MARSPKIDARKTEWLGKPNGAETSRNDGLRTLQLDCGHSCVTRQHTVVQETPCVLCGVYE